MKNQVNIVSKIYQNVMEELVQEEIEKQIKIYPRSLVEYVNKIEIAAYALNRLPPLYASCEKGKHQQKLLGRRQYKEQIKMAVRQGIAAVQRDPLRVSTPLISEIATNYQVAETALKDLQQFLESRNLTNQQEISWNNLMSVVRKAFNKLTWTNDLEPLPLPSQPVEEEDSWFKSRRYYSNKT